MLDIFNGDLFGVTSLTASINKLPYKPSRLGELKLFDESGITTTTAIVEEMQGRLSLLKTYARGTMPQVEASGTRKGRAFVVPHIPANATVLADEVQDVRAFGDESQEETVADLVNQKLTRLRQGHELTHEYHRVGAVHGKVLDADGSTVIYNFFTEFGITETVVTFDFTKGNQDLQQTCLTIVRAVEDALGGTPFDHVHAICGNSFWDAFITHDSVREAYRYYQQNQNMREILPQRRGFDFCDIKWENYRGSIGGTKFVADNTARFFAVGAPDLFTCSWAPADFIETVNTIGKPIYAKQETMPFGKGINIHTQSNPLFMCSRPASLIKGLKSP